MSIPAINEVMKQQLAIVLHAAGKECDRMLDDCTCAGFAPSCTGCAKRKPVLGAILRLAMHYDIDTIKEEDD